MGKLLGHNASINKLICLVLSFTLAFYSLGTPAFAQEIAAADDAAETSAVVTPAAVEEPSSDVEVIPQEEPASPEDEQEEGEDGSSTGEPEPDPDNPGSPIEGEAGRPDYIFDGDPQEVDAPFTVEIDPFSVAYDKSTHCIEYAVKVENHSADELKDLQISYSATCSQDISLSPQVVSQQGSYTIAPYGSATIGMRAYIEPYDDAPEPPMAELFVGFDYMYVVPTYVEDGYQHANQCTCSASDTFYLEMPSEYGASFEMQFMSSVLYDAQDNIIKDDNPVPGSTVEFTYLIQNKSAKAIEGASLSAYKTLTGDALSIDYDKEAEGLNPDDFMLLPYQSVCFTFRYEVSDKDISNQVIDATLSMTAGDVTKTDSCAAYKMSNEFAYHTEYYQDLGNGLELIWTTEKGVANLGDVIEAKAGEEEGFLEFLLPKEGYVAQSEPLTISSNEEENVLRIEYTRASFPYTINYYQDEVSPETLLSKQVIDDETNVVPYGQQVALDEDELINAYLPRGYSRLGVKDVPSITIGANADENVINVVYAQKNSYKYTINYYKDSTSGELLNVASDPDSYVAEAEFGSKVALLPEVLNMHKPDGYADLTNTPSFVVTDVEADNVLNIVYSQKNDYGYTVNYYYGEIKGTPDFTDQTNAAPFGSTVTISDDVANAHLVPGYDRATGYSKVITSNPQENVFDIVYARTQNIPYVINFYTDSASPENLIGTKSGTGTFEERFVLSPEDINAYMPPAGFVPQTQSRSITVGADPSKNVFNIVFERAQYSYTINYYKKEIRQDKEVETYIGSYTPETTVPYGSTVNVDLATLNKYAPQEGYIAKTKADETSFTITEDRASNCFNVVYELDSFGYTVNFYKDSVKPENKLGESITGVTKYGDIQAFFNDVINSRCPDGYARLEGQRFITVGADASKNVLNIVYADKNAEMPYRIYYYLDSIAPENQFDYAEAYGTYGAPITYKPSAKLPEGYNASNPTPSGSKYINATIEDSTLFLVFTKNKYEYTVNYYKDSVSEGNLLHSQGGIAEYGSKIPYDASAYVPEGYDSQSFDVTGAPTITINPDNNVLNVIYTGTPGIGYKVQYFAGSNQGLPFTTTIGVGMVGDAITYDASIIPPIGFSAQDPKLIGARTITEDASANVLDVVFAQAEYGYTVNYYTDEISSKTLIRSVQGVGRYNDPIPYANGAYCPAGYDANGLASGAPSIGYDEKQNIINVVYKPARFSYTINYYRGTAAPENLISSAVQEPRLFGSLVEITADELNYFMPEGYERMTEGTTLEISAYPQDNVVDIVFMPDFSGFYNSSIAPLQAQYDGSKHYLAAPQGYYENDIITYVYNGGVQTRIVGADLNLAAEFEDATDGDVPVMITLTRAGITSNVLTSAVNITPAPPAVEEPPVVITPAEPEEITYVVTLPEAIAAVIEPIAEAVQELAEPSYENMTGGVVAKVLTETIDDDANPLANMRTNASLHSVLQPESLMSPSDLMDLTLLFLAAVCLVLCALFLMMRRQTLVHPLVLKGESLAVMRTRMRALAIASLISSFIGIGFFILWCLMRL